jgi:phage replication O-like protein O
MSKENLVLADLYKEGYTYIPNFYFDNILPSLTLIEDRVLQIIFRKTFGSQKTKDQITITQLITLTKLAKSSIQKAIKSLKDKELIFVEKSEKSTSHIPSTYKINARKMRGQDVGK